MMTPEQGVFAAILICCGGAVLTLLTAHRRTLAAWLAFLALAASTGLVALAGGEVLAGVRAQPAAGWLGVRAACQQLHVDGLSAIFLLPAAGVALPVSLYSIHYMRHYPGTVARYYPYFLLWVAASYGLLSTADNTWWFLIFWQMMIFSGYALMRFDRSAGAEGANRFAIMLELACAAIVAGTGLLGGLPESMLAYVLIFLGFAITAGLWPFGQMWLPHASPAAPAPVSAWLCGVVIKIGAYGLIRYFAFLPENAHSALGTWGALMALLATITLFAGTMQALQQEHAKRLLAFHSLGQMGYIVLAVGTCLALQRTPAAVAVASFALLAALFHIVNHSLFSTLLYFNAGSVFEATDTYDLNRLGGLMKYMPLTGLTALVGAFSISGVPLFNGFASKWTIFVAAIQGAGSAPYLAVCAAIAILTSGLTFASFIKFFGCTFLSRTSELVRRKAGLQETGISAHGGGLEVGWIMQAPQLLLAFLCIALGVAPGLAFVFLQRALAAMPQVAGGELASAAPAATPFAGMAGPLGASVFVPSALVAALGATFIASYIISKLGSSPRRVAAPWLCGYASDAESQRYIAHNFYGEIKRYFRWVGGITNGKATAKERAS